MKKKMQTGVVLQNGAARSEAALGQCGDDGVALDFISGFESGEMLFEMSFAQKFGESILLEAGDCAGIKAELFVEFGRQKSGEHHVAYTQRGCDSF